MGTIPSSIQKPSRYSGAEVRRPLRPWSEARVRFLLAFPDVYEIGMSHLGLHVLYDIVNGLPGALCERVFAPWPDMEAHLRAVGASLASLESGRPAGDFDVVGFSLCYELNYTNVLQMLELAGIPLLRGERREEDPIVLAGGVCTFNPAPAAPFFDAMLVGDGEEAVPEIVRAVASRGGRPRDALLRELAGIDGVYVPGVSTGVTRRVLPDLSRSPLPDAPLLPAMRVVHDRLSIEISRGCTRGCRFCQAGYVYRPVRERDPAALRRYLEEVAPRTGYDEVGLLSLSAADYGCIDSLITGAMETLAPERISISLPSLRLDALRENTVRQIRKVRKTGFTLAPEAGTERLRRVINKETRDEELLRSADFIFGNGWQTLKLYFMVGFPGETAEDVRAIGELAHRVAAVARRHGRRNMVNVSVSAFVPKPHTPFQWERQISRGEIAERVAMIRSAAGGNRNLDLKFHAPHVSELEGAFSRGDARMADVLLRAYRHGARFDAWTETFREEAWTRAFDEAGVDPGRCLDARNTGGPLPWDFVDARIDKAFLLAEREKARSGETTPDCRTDRCSGCGACPPGLGNVTFRARDAAGEPTAPDEGIRGRTASGPPADRYILRVRYAKGGPASYLSGLEIQSLWGRIFRRAGLPLSYSQGFNPSPRLSMSPALPVGTESRAEFVEAELSLPSPAARAAAHLSAHLPPGIEILEVHQVPPGSPRLSDHDIRCTYRIDPAPGCDDPGTIDPADAAGAWRAFDGSASFPMEIEREGQRSVVDIRPLVAGFEVDSGRLFITIIHGTGRGVRPLAAAGAILARPFPPERYVPVKISAELVRRR